MPRLLLAALVIALVVYLLAHALRAVRETASGVRSRAAALPSLGETPMQRLSFVLLVALIFYAAIWGAA